MNQQELAKRQERAASEALVMTEVDGGFNVYAVTDPKRAYAVSGLPEAPRCTCADFQRHSGDVAWRCKHILAVEERFFGNNGAAQSDSYDAAERQAIQDESRSPARRRKPAPPQPGANAAQLLLKRSMSPDGRIDSLSVEFSCPVGDLDAASIRTRAKDVLHLQSGILADFMGSVPRNGNGGPKLVTANGNGRATPASNGTPTGGNGVEHPAAVPIGTVGAQMLAIGGMDGKWGRRLFLVFDIDGRQTRFFGNRKQLAEAINGAGYAGLMANIAEGVHLNVPCRVTTEPSPDGRFMNVVKVFPPNGAEQ